MESKPSAPRSACCTITSSCSIRSAGPRTRPTLLRSRWVRTPGPFSNPYLGYVSPTGVAGDPFPGAAIFPSQGTYVSIPPNVPVRIHRAVERELSEADCQGLAGDGNVHRQPHGQHPWFKRYQCAAAQPDCHDIERAGAPPVDTAESDAGRILQRHRPNRRRGGRRATRPYCSNSSTASPTVSPGWRTTRGRTASARGISAANLQGTTIRIPTTATPKEAIATSTAGISSTPR